MKSYRIYLFGALLAGLCSAGCESSKPTDAPYDGMLYIDAAAKTDKIALKKNIVTAVRSLQVAAPKPASCDVEITWADDASLVARYNEGFYDQAVMLPAENYELTGKTSLLNKGTVLSPAVEIAFKDLDKLSATQTYVLPVTIAEAKGMPVLESARTMYYVLKNSPSIEVVADMENKNHVKLPTFAESKPSAEVCNNLQKFTLESLIRVRKFESRIQSIMGTEGYFLLRVSDNGLANNQLQLVTPLGNISSENCMLTPNRWTHVAATFDMEARAIVLYVDGVEVARKENLSNMEPASFGKPMGMAKNIFYIGYSYAPGRELNGEMSECRIWNVVRTPEELAAYVYEVDPATPGLVAYWKLNEGKGKNIKDYTGNLNDGVASDILKWTSVWLPEIE